jgi:hypothetical protein
MSAHERAGLGDLLGRVVRTATGGRWPSTTHVVRSVATRDRVRRGQEDRRGTADTVFDSADVKRVFLRGRRDA